MPPEPGSHRVLHPGSTGYASRRSLSSTNFNQRSHIALGIGQCQTYAHVVVERAQAICQFAARGPGLP